MGERRSAWWAISQFMRRADLPVANHVPHEDSDANDEAMQSQADGDGAVHAGRSSRKSALSNSRLSCPRPGLTGSLSATADGSWCREEIVDQWNQFRAQDEANLGKPRPLVYSSRRQRRKFNGQISFLGEVADCLIHPETAAEHGIADGQKVRVFNKAGEITVTAKIDPTMLRGVCSIPHGHVDANINELTCTKTSTRWEEWRTTARCRSRIEPAPSLGSAHGNP